jgi:uncharacterized membrane protein
MITAPKQEPGRSNTAPPFPATTSEIITTVAHFHRAEMGRMGSWRERIDRTTNWAITVVAAMLSLSLSTATAHHGVLLFAMLLVMLLLLIEARRYRFFDVYRARVRRLERNYFAQLFAPSPQTDVDWAQILGSDLRQPCFLITLPAAISRRLRRNYIWMFLVLLLGWVLKLTTPRLQEEGTRRDLVGSLEEMTASATLGPLPGWLVLIAVMAFYLWLAYATLRSDGRAGELAYGDVHV